MKHTLRRIGVATSFVALACSFPGFAHTCVRSAINSTQPAKPGAATITPPLKVTVLGSLMFGGTVETQTNGETFHGNHGYAQYLIPAHANEFPIVMWHGAGQSGKTWETTPDGREGFNVMFARRGWSTFVIDQPRRGRASKAKAAPGAVGHNPGATESTLWANFRLGAWNPPAGPTFFPGVQFPQNTNAVDQFLRQQAANSAPEPFPDASERAFEAKTMGALLNRTGPIILMTHSHSSQYGWETAMTYPDKIKAIVSFEPGEFAFSEGMTVADIPTQNDLLRKFMAPQFVPEEKFRALTRMPIRIYFGDNMSTTPNAEYGIELWRMVRIRATQFANAVNAAGGHVEIIDLPKIGICGNTHFAMSDLNSTEVAETAFSFLRAHHLDGRRRSFKLMPGPDIQP